MADLSEIDTTTWGVDKSQIENIPKIKANFEIIKAAGTGGTTTGMSPIVAALVFGRGK